MAHSLLASGTDRRQGSAWEIERVVRREIDGRTILILYAPGGETRPYRAKASLSTGSRDWAYYIRKHSSMVRARGEDERELLGLAATVPFDDRYHQNASLDDLSLRPIQQHLQDVGSDLLSQVTVVAEPLHREEQPAGRLRWWGEVTVPGEAQPRILRVATLEDGETVHSAFFDRGFRRGTT